MYWDTFLNTFLGDSLFFIIDSEILYLFIKSILHTGIPPSAQSVAQDTRINGVSPWSTYEFRVVAQNELGLGEPSEPSESLDTPRRSKWYTIQIVVNRPTYQVLRFHGVTPTYFQPP